MSDYSKALLRTERLTLRMPVVQDFDAYLRLMASPRAVGMGGPFDVRAAWGMFCHDVAQWQLFGHGAFMIDIEASGECVGQVGINHGPLFPEKELGWFLYDGHERRGFATEAAAALLDWALVELRPASLVSYVDPDNIASQAVAVRIGGSLDPLAPRTDPHDLVYRYNLR